MSSSPPEPDDPTAEWEPLDPPSTFVWEPPDPDRTTEFCPPFPPTSSDPRLTFDPQWRTETVVALARGIDADAAYDRLPILADALEEAGCDHPPLLHHCRTCPHPFACCWVVNVILDRVPGELPPVVNDLAPSPWIPVTGSSPRATFSERLRSSVGWKYVAWGIFIFMVVFQLLRMLNIIAPLPPSPTVTLSSTTP